MQLIIFGLMAFGCYLVATSFLQGVYAPAEAALRKRAPKPLPQSELMVQGIASKLQQLMDIEPVKRIRMEEMLRSLGRTESPEMFQALALAKALLIAVALSPLLLVSPLVAAMLMAVTCIALYSNQMQRLERDIAEKRQRIERELPQFASTIRQSLNNTHDVVAILATYRKVCGPVLRDEIDHTLNDMVTGNEERALKSLESRVSSAKLGQLVRGLIAVLRGDDQRIYFDMLSAEYRKSQNEEVAKELLKRPGELMPNMGMLFTGMALMIAAALGTYIVQQFTLYFN